jgi:predicted RNase H-like nuclease (RuvC/YqgF family)
MLNPTIPTRVIQPYGLTAQWIDCLDPGTFVEIAAVTRKTEVFELASSTLADREDVVYCNGDAAVGLWRLAICATMIVDVNQLLA